MPKYLYTAKNISSGETKGGEIIGKDENQVAQELRTQGFLVTSLKLIEDSTEGIQVKFFDRFMTVPLKEKMVFTRNLAVMTSSGLTVSRAIHNLSVQTQNKRFQKILQSVHDDVQAGKQLSEGLAKYPSVFNELFVNMVSVGEISGNLESVLDILALQLEKENDLLSKVRGALIYPAVILVAMIGIAVLMLTYILPKITAVFVDMAVELPPLTRFLIAASDLLRVHWIIVVISVIISLIGIRVAAKTDAGRHFLNWLVLRLPIVGSIVVKVNCARFSRIYSSLLKSGISVVSALTIVSRTLGNVYYKEALIQGIEEVQKGTELSRVTEQHPRIFPILVTQIIQVGEETGKTEDVLQRLAEFYEEEVSQITKNMSSIIEPILMLLIGTSVGFFAVAMLQPMYSVLENIK
jgi:type IV pilus assembly protein PilC